MDMTTPMRPDVDEKKRTRLIYLKKQHRDLDNGIITAFKMRTEDGVVSKLKLKKLHLKEEIVRLEEELQS
jgi:hypothetical protein|tara:strand:+ start:283 stop:492 length:210 start_codon:yes stop_codon:yes gene_type:complete